MGQPICTPIRYHNIMFSGHKRTHGVKFQVCQSLKLDIKLLSAKLGLLLGNLLSFSPALMLHIVVQMKNVNDINFDI